MNAEERELVLGRLQELEAWSEYIFEALLLDPCSEPAKRDMLERVVDQQGLRQLRELSWSLRDKLHLMAIQVELTRTEQTATQGRRG